MAGAVEVSGWEKTETMETESPTDKTDSISALASIKANVENFLFNVPVEAARLSQ